MIVGLFGGGATFALPLIPIKAITIQGSYVGNLRETQELLDLVRSKKIPPIPVTTVPLAKANEALTRSAEGQTGRPRGADAVSASILVMAGLVPAIHVLPYARTSLPGIWRRGLLRLRPGMTNFKVSLFDPKESPCPPTTLSTSPCSAAMASALK